jgi:hypothetical protein
VDVTMPRGDRLASVALAFGAALWGLYWIPIRGIEQAGVEPFGLREPVGAALIVSAGVVEVMRQQNLPKSVIEV